MKRLILIITIIFVTILPSFAVKKIEANPINVAVIIVETGDSAKIASLFDYYGYEKQTVKNGRQVMRTSNGHEMTYTFQEEGTSLQYPIIEVKTKATQKEIDSILRELNFKKVGNAYERTISRYNRYITRCILGPSYTLILQRIHSNK